MTEPLRKQATCTSKKALLVVIVLLQLTVVLRGTPQVAMVENAASKPSHFNIPKKRRLAIASFVDKPEHLYGVFTTMKQMGKFNMSGKGGVEQVVIVPSKLKRNGKAWNALTSWMQGPDKHIYQVDRNFIIGKIPTSSRLWAQTFNKLWMFNMTDFDRLIVLDGDILIRTSIKHWFDYPAPCATQAGQIERNSGAMVIDPSSEDSDRMMQILPDASRYSNSTQHENWNSDYSDQGFITSFFTTSLDASERMKTMPLESSSTSSYLSGNKNPLRYYKLFRPHIIETVHFTVHKPYIDTTSETDPFICDMFQEWFESIHGIDAFLYHPVIQHDIFRHCPNATQYDQFRNSSTPA